MHYKNLSSNTRTQQKLKRPVNNITLQIRSKQRVIDYGEVYTSEREVKAMLDLVKQETQRIESRFFEPACGTGNFLVEVLRRKLEVVKTLYSNRKLEYERYAVIAVSSLYGIDILEDNVIYCRKRLYDCFNENYMKEYDRPCSDKCLNSINFILSRNIIWGDALTTETVCDNPRPIILSDWHSVNNGMIKRKDYLLAHLLKQQSNQATGLVSDPNIEVLIPKPIHEFPLIHYLKLGQHV